MRPNPWNCKTLQLRWYHLARTKMLTVSVSVWVGVRGEGDDSLTWVSRRTLLHTVCGIVSYLSTLVAKWLRLLHTSEGYSFSQVSVSVPAPLNQHPQSLGPPPENLGHLRSENLGQKQPQRACSWHLGTRIRDRGSGVSH